MFTRTRWIQLVCASVVLLLCVTGCFRRGPELAPVTGTGYELKYTKDKSGGVVGSHVVRITTQMTAVDPESGNEIQVPQRVPERYNERSQLIREVKPGENQIDFALTSEPETEETGLAEDEAAEGGAEEPKIEGRDTEDADTQTPATEKAAARAPESASPDTENAAPEQPDTPEVKAEQPAAEES